MAICKKRTTSEHTEMSIQRAFYKAKWKDFRLVIPNFFAHGNFGFESDLMCVRKSGYAVEIEVKISASDFRNDAKKCVNDTSVEPVRLEKQVSWGVVNTFEYPTISKYELLRTGRLVSNYFYYLMPRDLGEKLLPEMPDFAGLMVIEGWGGITELKKAELLHKAKMTDKLLAGMAGNLSHRYWDELLRPRS
ncbi:hypothetical protein SUSUWATARI_00020 [Serratia phage vB_SmaM-Susuwatari]|nr:hypothetical protein SUSUWATARI_00020 [Serratia phage vB_SmaM-Susuwatari]